LQILMSNASFFGVCENSRKKRWSRWRPRSRGDTVASLFSEALEMWTQCAQRPRTKSLVCGVSVNVGTRHFGRNVMRRLSV